jgi:hypothetical protein
MPLPGAPFGMKIWRTALGRRHLGFRSHAAGRGRPVSSRMEPPRPRGAREDHIFIEVPHDLFQLTTADENGRLVRSSTFRLPLPQAC